MENQLPKEINLVTDFSSIFTEEATWMYTSKVFKKCVNKSLRSVVGFPVSFGILQLSLNMENLFEIVWENSANGPCFSKKSACYCFL